MSTDDKIEIEIKHLTICEFQTFPSLQNPFYCHLDLHPAALTHSIMAALMWHFCKLRLLIDKGLHEVEISLHLCNELLNILIIYVVVSSLCSLVRTMVFLFPFCIYEIQFLISISFYF